MVQWTEGSSGKVIVVLRYKQKISKQTSIITVYILSQRRLPVINYHLLSTWPWTTCDHVDFGIFGFLIPLVNLLYTNTSIPTGESSYISIGIFTLFTETGGKDKLLPYGFRWSKSPVLSDQGAESQDWICKYESVNKPPFICLFYRKPLWWAYIET